MTNETSFTGWRKATASNGSDNCVEVARAQDMVGVRDSKNPGGAVLVFAAADFTAFLHAVRSDDL